MVFPFDPTSFVHSFGVFYAVVHAGNSLQSLYPIPENWLVSEEVGYKSKLSKSNQLNNYKSLFFNLKSIWGNYDQSRVESGFHLSLHD